MDQSSEWFQRACVDVFAMNSAESSHGPVVKLEKWWDNGAKITFSFMEEKGGELTQQNKVKEAITEWEKYANIKFEYSSDCANATIRITFDERSGSWSYVGRNNTEVESWEATMNLARIGSQESIESWERGLILHEFGHVLGMVHEHQSPSCQPAITLKKEAVLESYQKVNSEWSPQRIQSRVIDVYNTKEMGNSTEYDPSSIMIHFVPKEMNEQGMEVEANNELSEKDKALVQLQYPLYRVNALRDSENSFLGALGVLGLQDVDKQKLTRHYYNGNWRHIRQEFQNIYDKVRAERNA